METRTLEQLEVALAADDEDLSPRVEELAQKSTAGLLTPEERDEYAAIVRLNDMRSLVRFQADLLRPGPAGTRRQSHSAIFR
jgi:hypothetical protein